MASGFNVWHGRLPPLHKISFQIRILLLRSLCKALVYRLLLAAAALALGKGGIAPSSHAFHLSVSPLPSGIGVTIALSFFRSSFPCVSAPTPFLCLCCFPIPSWFPAEQRELGRETALWQPSVGWDRMVAVKEHDPLIPHLPAQPRVT